MENLELEKEAKKLEAEYHRKWRAENKDKVREINKRYWLKRALKSKREKEE